jgi:hypothetical protein
MRACVVRPACVNEKNPELTDGELETYKMAPKKSLLIERKSYGTNPEFIHFLKDLRALGCSGLLASTPTSKHTHSQGVANLI